MPVCRPSGVRCVNGGTVFGYNYGIIRSLSSEFHSLDMDTHTFSLGTYYSPTSKLNVGINGAYSLEYYQQHVQNDGTVWSVGPFATWALTDFITLEAAAGYSDASYRQTGSILDSSSFRGITYQGGIRHRMNSHMTQSLRGGHSVGLGYGSNFTEIWSAQHTLTWEVVRGITLNSTLSWERFKASTVRANDPSSADSGYQVVYYLGTAFQFTRHWGAAVAYAFALKNSDLPDRDYVQNRLTLDVRREF